MKTQCPVCDTTHHLPEGEGPTKVKCAGCHATYTAEPTTATDKSAGWPGSSGRSRPWTTSSQKIVSQTERALFGDPERADALVGWPDEDEGEDFLSGASGRAFDPNRPIQIPETRSGSTKPGPTRSPLPRQSRLDDQNALFEAASDIPTGGGGAAQVGLPENRKEPEPFHDTAPPQREKRPMGVGPKLLVLAVLLGVLAAVAWVSMGDTLLTEAEGAFDALGIALEEAGDDAVATAQKAEEERAAAAPPVPSGPRAQGKYIEHIEERGGRKVRVWAPKDSKPMAGTGQPPNQPRKRAPKASRAKPAKSYPKAPRFILKDANGGKVDLNKLRGKVIVLNFFATWCQPCRKEIPHFAQLYNETRGKGKVEFYGVLMESGELGKAVAASKRMGVNYPLVAGNLVVKHNYRVEGYPTTVIIDAKGRIRVTEVGMVKYEQLRKMVAGALK